MERGLFESRFRAAAAQALEFARIFIEEPLPDALRFRVQLNASYDAHATPEFRLFPDDTSPDELLSADQFVDLVWRDGRVPQWIDIAVASEQGDATIMRLTVCGRFIDDESRLYYVWTDVAPFGVKGPTLPPKWTEGVKFSIHHWTTCATAADLECAIAHAAKVGFLDVRRSAVDDHAMGRLRGFTNVTCLWLNGVHRAFALERFPKLATLHLDLAGAPPFDLRELAHPALEGVYVTNLPGEITGVARLAEGAPRLATLHLGAAGRVVADGLLTVPVRELWVSMLAVPEWIAPSHALRSFRVSAPEGDDETIAALLEQCPAELEHVWLDKTPVTDAILGRLERFRALKFVSVANTRVSAEALARFVEPRAGIRYFPRKVKP